MDMHSRSSIILLMLALCLGTTLGQKVVCRQRPMDIVFVLDGSRSVRPYNFRTIQEVVTKMIDNFDEISPTTIQVGVVQFASRIRQEFNLNQYYTKKEVKDAIATIDYMEMGTMTGKALKFLVEKTFTQSMGARMNPDTAKVAVIITDGRSQDKTVNYWQKKVKDSGIEIFAIGVGRRISDKDLTLLASSPKEKHKFYAKNFEAFRDLHVMITENICDLKAPLPQDIVFTEKTHTSMRASWQLDVPEAASDVIKYVVSYARSDGKGERRTAEVTEPTILMTDLEPGTDYTLSVSAVTEYDFSPSVRGNDSTLFLGETTVILNHPGISTLTARWQPAGGDRLTGYDLRYYKISDDPEVAPEEILSKHVAPDVHQDVVTGLNPETTYKVRVTPRHGKLEGGAGEDTETTKSVPQTQVRISETTLSTAEVQWPDVGAKQYKVSIHPTDDPENVETVTVSGEQTSHLFRNLDPDTNYTATLVATIPQDGVDFDTPPVTDEEKTKKLSPPNVDITETTLSTADVLWTVTGHYPQYYRVSYCPRGNPDDKKTVKVEDISTKLTDLEPGTEYMVEVTGHVYEDDKLFSSEPGSDTDVTKSLPAPIVVARPRSLTSATIRWSGIDVPVDRYRVTYYPKTGDAPEQVVLVDGTETTLPLLNLQHNTSYNVIVVGYVTDNGKQFTTPEGMAMFMLGSLGPPDVKIPSTTMTTLDVTWMHDVDAESYTVTIYSTETVTQIETVTISGEITEYTFESLTPGTEYEVTVVARVQDEGTELVSPTGSATGVTRPAPPRNLSARPGPAITSTFDPSDGGSDYYEVVCFPRGGNPEDYPTIRIDKRSDLTAVCETEPAVEYEIDVVNVYRGMKSPPAKVYVQTELGPPLRFDMSNPTTHTIEASWELPEGVEEVSHYLLNYWSEESGDTSRYSVPGNDTTYLLNKLNPNTRYSGEIRAYFRGVLSPPASDQERTLPDRAALEVTDVGYNDVSVTWPKSKVPHLHRYELSYITRQRLPTDEPSTYQLRPDLTSYVIRGLSPATIYDLNIKYIYPDENSIEATNEAVTLAPPPGPLVFSEHTYTSFVVMWTKPEYSAEPIGYTVTYVPVMGETEISIDVPSGVIEEFETELRDLGIGTKYNVSVVANYNYDIVSQPSKGQNSTLEPVADFECSCQMYMNAQSKMQSTLLKLVEQIEKLNRKIDGMERKEEFDLERSRR